MPKGPVMNWLRVRRLVSGSLWSSQVVNHGALLATCMGTNAGQPELVHAVAVRANMRSILVAMMKSFSCSPLIFLVCRETVALPQPKLIFG